MAKGECPYKLHSHGIMEHTWPCALVSVWRFMKQKSTETNDMAGFKPPFNFKAIYNLSTTTSPHSLPKPSFSLSEITIHTSLCLFYLLCTNLGWLNYGRSSLFPSVIIIIDIDIYKNSAISLINLQAHRIVVFRILNSSHPFTNPDPFLCFCARFSFDSTP